MLRVSVSKATFRYVLARAAILMAAPLLTGCGGGTEAGTVSVQGLVTLDGKPVESAGVGFIGREGARLASATTDKAGKFTIRASLGKNLVTVAKESAGPAPPPSDEPMLMPTQGEYQKMQAAVKSEIPAKYGDPKTSGLAVEAKAGMPEVELALSSK
jgi:hypothetical protein